VDDITQGISGVGISDNDDVSDKGSICGSCTDSSTEICANCGKEGANNTCNKCKLVKYFNAACKKKHKTKHKKACEERVKRAAELHKEDIRRATELHDLELFKQPPPEEDCPICFIRLPLIGTGRKYKACCGKTICSGCIYAVRRTKETAVPLCPFSRVPTPTTEEDAIQQYEKRVDVGDAEAMSVLGSSYSTGDNGLPQDYAKAMELYHRAADLGYAGAYYNIGNAYCFGRGVARDMKKAVYYHELGAVGGHLGSRLTLGVIEARGNIERAIKHYLIAVKGGESHSLKQIQNLYHDGHATKDVYTQALRAYQEYLGEVKSSQRDEAAAASDEQKYL